MGKALSGAFLIHGTMSDDDTDRSQFTPTARSDARVKWPLTRKESLVEYATGRVQALFWPTVKVIWPGFRVLAVDCFVDPPRRSRTFASEDFTLLTCDRSDYLTDRYSERKEAAEKEAKRLAAEAMRQEVKAAE